MEEWKKNSDCKQLLLKSSPKQTLRKMTIASSSGLSFLRLFSYCKANLTNIHNCQNG